MPRVLIGALTLVLLAVATACGSGDDAEEPAAGGPFDPAQASEQAHAALPVVADLPSTGWVVTEQDKPEKDLSGFVIIAANQPSCAHVSDLSLLSGVLGGALAVRPPIARAQVELERPNPGGQIATSVSVEIEVSERADEVAVAWGLVRQLFEHPRTATCIADITAASVAAGDPFKSTTVKLEPVNTLAKAPAGGFGLGFDITIFLAGQVRSQGVLEYYLWPHENSLVSVGVAGPPGVMSAPFSEGVLRLVGIRIGEATSRD